MNCTDCAKSAAQSWHGFRANCLGCAARAVSRGPNYRRCLSAGRLDHRYTDELRLHGVTHAEAKAAAALDFERRGVAA